MAGTFRLMHNGASLPMTPEECSALSKEKVIYTTGSERLSTVWHLVPGKTWDHVESVLAKLEGM